MILLAVEEAVVNVIEHAFEPAEKASFQIIIEPSTTGLKIIVKDKGLPYAPSLVPTYAVDSDLEKMESSGLGSYLMRKSMDEVTFHNLGKEGKELHLVRRLPFRNISDYHAPEETDQHLAQAPQPGALQLDGPLEIRLTRLSETVEVSRLFYRSYGYSYVHDSIYYPDRFAQLIEEGEIISAVAVTGEDQIIGHGGLAMEEGHRRVAEAGMAATKPLMRGIGGMTKIVQFLIEYAKNQGMEGLFARAVADHPFSQKTGFKCGFRDCGILLGIGLPDTDYKNIVGLVTQRVSLVCSFLPLVEVSRCILYPPEHHRSIVEEIYDNLVIDATFVASDVNDLRKTEERTLLKSRVIPSDSRAEIVLTGYGKDTAAELAHVLKDLLHRKVEEISLYLDLQDPMTASLCREFEALGFFFSGVMPFLHFDHTLILQYLNNITLDYAQLKVASDFGHRLLNYVRERDPNQ
jgi:serine/threonine-protein kinase RsbW